MLDAWARRGFRIGATVRCLKRRPVRETDVVNEPRPLRAAGRRLGAGSRPSRGVALDWVIAVASMCIDSMCCQAHRAISPADIRPPGLSRASLLCLLPWEGQNPRGLRTRSLSFDCVSVLVLFTAQIRPPLFRAVHTFHIYISGFFRLMSSAPRSAFLAVVVIAIIAPSNVGGCAFAICRCRCRCRWKSSSWQNSSLPELQTHARLAALPPPPFRDCSRPGQGCGSGDLPLPPEPGGPLRAGRRHLPNIQEAPTPLQPAGLRRMGLPHLDRSQLRLPVPVLPAGPPGGRPAHSSLLLLPRRHGGAVQRDRGDL